MNERAIRQRTHIPGIFHLLKAPMTIKTQNSPEKTALLAHQGAVAEAQAAVQKLDKAIAKQQALMQDAKTKEPDLEALRVARNTTLAEVALGLKTGDDLAALDKSIETAEAIKSTIGPSVKRAQETIDGLNRILQISQEKCASLQGKSNGLQVSLLMSEAEAQGAQYAALACELIGQYKRMVALGVLLRQKGQAHSIEPHNAKLSIPCFSLESNKPYAAFNQPSSMFLPPSTGVDVMPWMEQEQARLRADGIEI